jgi:transcriptional regulator with XRE-family HTH domain
VASHDERDRLRSRFAQAVRFQRLREGLTQQQLADLVGRHKAQISRLEAGHRHADVAEAAMIARALHTSIDELLSGPR